MIRRLALPLLVLGLGLALAFLPDSAAMTRTVNRPPAASLGSDPGAALALVSFGNTGFSINANTYAGAGAITNNFSVPIAVTMTATPTITQSCSSVDATGNCVPSAWNLYLCLATDQTSIGAKQCRAAGQADQITFSGTGPGTVAAQNFVSFTVASRQTLYLLVKGSPKQTSATSRLCGQAGFAVTGTSTKGQSVTLSNGPGVPRSQIYRMGTGCP